MTTDTLKVTFGQDADHREAARERLARAEAGERGTDIEQEDRFILNFEDFEEIESLMRRSILTLLETIVTEQPESIRETADLVDRDYKEVHRNLNELESLGIIEFETKGASQRPILRGGARKIDFSFTLDEVSVDDRSGASA